MLEIIKKELGISEEMARKRICQFEEFLNKQSGAIHGKALGNPECPVVHSFGEGLYIRQITMPKGMLLTSKIHKYKHPYFVMSGDCSVITATESIRIKAPYWGITQPMTKRILYIHEETVWCTVHATESVDVDEIEKEIILPGFDNILEYKEGEELCLSWQQQ